MIDKIKRIIKKILGIKPKPHNTKNIEKNIIEAHKILNSIGVKHWLTDGTLLGFYRDGKILPHDIDADFGVFIKDYKYEIVTAFEKKGWKHIYTFGRISVGFELTFEKEGEHLDLFFFYEEGDKYWHGAWANAGGKKRYLIKYYYDKFDLKEADFLGEKFLIPADTEHYVETKYGKNWRTPVKNWDWVLGPANAVKTDIIIKWRKRKILP